MCRSETNSNTPTIYPISLLYSSTLHHYQHTDYNVPGTDVIIPPYIYTRDKISKLFPFFVLLK